MRKFYKKALCFTLAMSMAFTTLTAINNSKVMAAATVEEEDTTDYTVPGEFRFTIGGKVVNATSDGFVDRDVPKDLRGVFTDREIIEIENGADCVVNVNVTDGSNLFTDAVKGQIKSVLPGYKILRYININVSKRIVNDIYTVTHSSVKIPFRINITMDDLYQNPLLVKHFYLVSLNDGVVQLLPNTSNYPLSVISNLDRYGNYALVVEE